MVQAMIWESLFSWLASAVPLIGAVVSRMSVQDPQRLRQSCLMWSVLSLAPLIGTGMAMPEGPLPLFLLPIAAAISLLGQPVHASHSQSWLMTLVCLGLGIGVLAHHGFFSHLFLLGLMAVLISLLLHHHTTLWPISWLGISLFSLVGFGVIMASFSSDPLSSSVSLLVGMVLLPLLPFHSGYVTALTRLPGNLPSFAAVLLPSVGLHIVAATLSTVPLLIINLLSLFALMGALYGAVKALAQTRVRLILAYGSLSFFSMLWWFTASSHLATSRAAVLVVSIGLATCGLLIAWQVIRTRYGDDVDPMSISGLASSMPSYAVLLSLLALAAMGLPPFGVFTGLMGLLLHSPIPSLLGLLVMLSAWLAASWYIMGAVQRLLFGTWRQDLRYHDVVRGEWAALLLTIVVLAALGLAPNDWFMSRAAPPILEALSQGVTWQQ